MSRRVPGPLAKFVRERARDRCEYCLLPQSSQEAAFHIDHIKPASALGPTTAENLALACITCSLRKAARIDVVDPLSKQTVPLFHPRRDQWSDHFRWTPGCRLHGVTATGRATIRALGMNRPAVIAIRRTLSQLGMMIFTNE
ncbi:MAG TPA: HNH endonuclease signature motif containing protein [Gemmataceae bacterium]|jgi:5-methylcytosine-specific restriction endonuclease McrA|nr:HNH endonuclease signature motif containing protein [Gemmataceae bacterium]